MDCTTSKGLAGKITDFGCLPQDPIALASSLYGIGLSFIGGVALLFIIYAGFLIMTSSGNREQLETGKSYLFYSIAGLLLAIFGYVFLTVIAVDVLHIPGFSK